MKKYLLGLFAIAMAVGFSAFTKAPVKKTNSPSFAYWYAVNASHRTIGSTPLYTNKTQEDLIDGDCNDPGNNECFAGSGSTLPANTVVSSFPDEQKVSRQ